MNDYQLLPVGGELFYTPNFAADVPANVNVTAIAFSVEPNTSPVALVLAGKADDLSNSQSSIKVSGARHGVNYTLKATATLDNGEDLVKSIGILGFNG